MTDAEFRQLYREKGNETIYIAITNLAKVRAALSLLRDTLVTDDDPFIPAAERRKIITTLTIWHDKIANALSDDDDYLLNEDGEPIDYEDVDGEDDA